MITSEYFGTTKDGQEVLRYTLTNQSGMTVTALSYGCTIQRIIVPDKNGAPVDVALGYEDLRSYEEGWSFFGAVVGRFANRIKGAAFELNGETVRLKKNAGENHLHGLFSKRVFESEIQGDCVVFRYLSPDGEEDFPGNLQVEVRYRLTEDNALEIDYFAETDKDTVLNLTNHTYFNLNGTGDIFSHLLRLGSDCVTETDAASTPTGEFLSVENTPLDFRTEKPIGRDIFADDTTVKQCGGYDHNYVLNNGGELREFAVVKSPDSGIALTCSTTQPGVQLYTGNFIFVDKAARCKGGAPYEKYAGVCLETQHYPASPNYPHFPSTVLRRGEQFRETTVYRFRTYQS